MIFRMVVQAKRQWLHWMQTNPTLAVPNPNVIWSWRCLQIDCQMPPCLPLAHGQQLALRAWQQALFRLRADLQNNALPWRVDISSVQDLPVSLWRYKWPEVHVQCAYIAIIYVAHRNTKCSANLRHFSIENRRCQQLSQRVVDKAQILRVVHWHTGAVAPV